MKKRAFVINLEKLMSKTDERAGIHVMTKLTA